MSHSGLTANTPDFDDDWFIRGIDGRMCASWGSIDGGMIHVNPVIPATLKYTKKWIRFYMKECGAKGIFFDCLGWAFPPITGLELHAIPRRYQSHGVKFMEKSTRASKSATPTASCSRGYFIGSANQHLHNRIEPDPVCRRS